jgi:hypothetical protein
MADQQADNDDQGHDHGQGRYAGCAPVLSMEGVV